MCVCVCEPASVSDAALALFVGQWAGAGQRRRLGLRQRLGLGVRTHKELCGSLSLGDSPAPSVVT